MGGYPLVVKGEAVTPARRIERLVAAMRAIDRNPEFVAIFACDEKTAGLEPEPLMFAYHLPNSSADLIK